MSIPPVGQEGQDRPLRERLADIHLTARQLSFVLWYVTLGRNGTKAAIAAGYGKAGASVEATRTLAKPNVKRALAVVTAGEWAARAALMHRLAEIALEADIADYEPFLMGKASLGQLRRKGLDTRHVKAATIIRTTTRSKKSVTVHETRRIELYNSMEAAKELFPASQPDGGQEPRDAGGARSNVTLVALLQQQFLAASAKPFVPGIPRQMALPETSPATGGDDDHAGDDRAG